MIDRLTCILCPIGCELEVEVERKGEDENKWEIKDQSEKKGRDVGERVVIGEELGGKESILQGMDGTNDRIHQADPRSEGGIEDKTGKAQTDGGWLRSNGESCSAEKEIDGCRIRIRGHQCDKGVDFAFDEVLHPKRNLATSVPLAGTADRMVSVRLSGRVPREMIFPILAEIAKLRPSLPVRRGDVLIPNVAGSGVEVLATRTMI